MCYNENYQLGIILSIEFLKNNAGKIESYKQASAFYNSRYSKDYHRIEKPMKVLLFCID